MEQIGKTIWDYTVCGIVGFWLQDMLGEKIMGNWKRNGKIKEDYRHLQNLDKKWETSGEAEMI